MPAPPASRYPPNRPLSTSERIERREYARDNIAALARGMPLEKRSTEREDLANMWAGWFRQRMDSADCEPDALLPDAFARLEQMIDDRIAVAFKQFKTELKGVLK
jgi:hypothetical protein